MALKDSESSESMTAMEIITTRDDPWWNEFVLACIREGKKIMLDKIGASSETTPQTTTPERQDP